MDDLINILNSNTYSVPKTKPILIPLPQNQTTVLKNQHTDEVIELELEEEEELQEKLRQGIAEM